MSFSRSTVLSTVFQLLNDMHSMVQGVVTYMSRVEAFATGIKTESSDQSPLGGPIKGSR